MLGDRAVVDAVGSGLGWPHLRALLQMESARDILFALLVPNAAQLSALNASEAWVAEVKDLLKSSMGLHLRTRGKKWDSTRLFSIELVCLASALEIGLKRCVCV